MEGTREGEEGRGREGRREEEGIQGRGRGKEGGSDFTQCYFLRHDLEEKIYSNIANFILSIQFMIEKSSHSIPGCRATTKQNALQ